VSSSAHDLSAIFDKHVSNEFVARDVAATMATMTAEPFVNHVPTMMGGVGADEVADFYDRYFIGHWPADTTIIGVCRTVGADRVVDEMVMSFTHDIPMPTFLPGVAPTGRAVILPVVVVMGFEGEKVAYERIYWDQACLLVQVGLLDETLLPVTGAAQARKVLDKDLPANTLLKADQPGPPA
jgi:carboxymethylenebutenolidase